MVSHECERHPRPKMPEREMTEQQKEAWIDLVTLATRITWCACNGCVVIEHHDVKTKDLFLYQLRVALRAVGHKITEWTRATEENTENQAIICNTSIDDEETYIDALNVFDDWCCETDGYCPCDCRDECDCKSESESDEPDENPSN